MDLRPHLKDLIQEALSSPKAMNSEQLEAMALEQLKDCRVKTALMWVHLAKTEEHLPEDAVNGLLWQLCCELSETIAKRYSDNGFKLTPAELMEETKKILTNEVETLWDQVHQTFASFEKERTQKPGRN